MAVFPGIFTDHDPTRPNPRIGSGRFQNIAGRILSDQAVFEISRVGRAGSRAWSGWAGAGRVESGGFESHGSDWVALTPPDPRQVTRSVKCHGFFLVAYVIVVF